MELLWIGKKRNDKVCLTERMGAEHRCRGQKDSFHYILLYNFYAYTVIVLLVLIFTTNILKSIVPDFKK